MLKKLLAGLSALVLSLGMIALVAGPASAHTPDLTPTCTALDVELTNYATSSQHSNTVEVWIDGTQVTNTTFQGSFSHNYPFTSGPDTHTYRVKVVAWDDSKYNFDTGTTTISNCAPDDTSKKITLCHATGSNSNPYSVTTDSVNAIINHSGHGAHPNDIIPPFTYTLHGVPGSYAGQNWTTVNQLYYNNGCNAVNVTPTAVTFTDAVCVAAGQYGSGSFTISSVPTGVQYQYRTTSSGAWTNVGAGTTSVTAGLTVSVQAIALAGYNITGTHSWSHTITHPTASKCVVPVAPTLTQSLCTTPGNSSPAGYSIPSSTTIQYQIKVGSSWNNLTSGSHTISSFPTTVVIRAVAMGTNVIVPGSTTQWTFTFSSPGDCKVTVTPTVATFHDAVCTGPGTSDSNTYTIPVTTGVKYQVKIGTGSWNDVSDGTYNVGAVTISIQAVALSGYTLSGATSWNHSFSDAGLCLVSTEVTTIPTFIDAVCTGPGTLSDSSYTLTAVTGVDYQVSLDNSTFNPASAGQHFVSAGQHVWITASAQAGYTLVGPVAWDHAFPAPDCTVTAVPADPGHADQSCIVGQDGNGSFVSGYITIPNSTGVQYYINGSSVSAGNVLEAPGDYTVTATALSGYTLDSYPADGWPEHIASALPCGDVTPVEPTVADEICTPNVDGHGVFTPGYITIPSTVGVNYYLNSVLTAAGQYPESPGDYTVTFTAIPNYTLAGSYPADGWVETIKAADDCGNVYPVEPTVVDQSCVVDIDTNVGTLITGYIDIPSTVGVNYYINGVLAAAGHNELAPGDYTVTFAAIADYTLAGDFPADGWTETIRAAKLCGDLVTDASVFPIVTSTQGGCTTDGSYTLSNDLIEGAPGLPASAGAVIFTVDGSPVAAGTYHVTAPQTVHVHAEPNAPAFTFDDPNQQKDWTLVFAASTTCDLKTLALTGSDPTGGMLLAYFLVLAGLGIVTVRAVRRHGRPQE